MYIKSSEAMITLCAYSLVSGSAQFLYKSLSVREEWNQCDLSGGVSIEIKL